VTLVQIVKGWFSSNLLQQTPRNEGVWDGIQFTLDDVDGCDYVIVLDRPSEDKIVHCPPHHVWAVMQEPPNEMFRLIHKGDPSYARIYSSDERIEGTKYYKSQPSLAWYVNQDYDYLIKYVPSEKQNNLSWITSNKQVFRGHRDRMKFLAKIQGSIDFDLYGVGFQPIDDKWDGLEPYRYSLVIENYRNAFYWSEKLADCFLAWTMPIYFGCTRIHDYFPNEALINIDIHDPNIVERIREAICSNSWLRNRDAIAEARRLVLNRYQLFPFIAGEIQKHESDHPGEIHKIQPILLPHELRTPLTPVDRLRNFWRSIVPRKTRQRIAKIRQWFE